MQWVGEGVSCYTIVKVICNINLIKNLVGCNINCVLLFYAYLIKWLKCILLHNCIVPYRMSIQN